MNDKKLENYGISNTDMRILIKDEIQDAENEIKQLEKERIMIDTELKNNKNLEQRKVLIDDENQILNDIDDLKNQLKGLNQYLLHDIGEVEENKTVELTYDSKPPMETYETEEKSIDNEII